MSDYSLSPLVEANPADTVYLCKCAVGVLARIHEDRADHESDGMAPDHERGVGALLACVEIALAQAYADIDKPLSDPRDVGRPEAVG